MLLQKLKSNSFFNNTLFIFIIRFFPSLATLAIVLYYSRNLDKPTYGAYNNFWLQLYFIYPIACFGIHTLITTYAPASVLKLARSITRGQSIAYLLWVVLLAVVFGIMQASFLHIGFWIPFLFMLSFSGAIILESFLIVLRSLKSLALINLFYAAGFVFVHKLVLETGFSFGRIFLYLLLLTAAKMVLYVGLAGAFVKAKDHDDNVVVKPVKEVRKLWIDLGLYDILQNVESYVDKFAISLVVIPSLSAVYSNGAQNIPFLPVVMSAAGSAVLMQMHKVPDADENASLLRLMNYSTRMLSNIVFPLFFFLVFFRYELFGVLFPAYSASVPVFLICSFYVPLRAYNFTIVFQKKHKGHYSNIGGIIDIVLACIFIYPLYKWMGLPGVALAFVLSCYLQGVYYVYHISRLLNASPYKLVPLGNLFTKLIVFGFLFIGIHYICAPLFPQFITLILGAVSLVAVIGMSLFMELRNNRKYGNV